MADFVAVTASNRPRLKDADTARALVNCYHFDNDLEAEIALEARDGQPRLSVAGYGWPGAWRVPDGVDPLDFTPDYDENSGDGFEDFLHEIAPCLAEPWTVQAVGHTKCRFQLSACAWHVRPGGDVTITPLPDDRDREAPPSQSSYR
jgi:hypothetical protein